MRFPEECLETTKESVSALAEQVAERHDANASVVMMEFYEVVDEMAWSVVELTEEEWRQAWRETNNRFKEMTPAE